MTYHRHIDSPTGVLRLECDDRYLTGVDWIAPSTGRRAGKEHSHPLLDQAALELEEYFAGNRTRFTLPLQPVGTEFQRTVWRRLEAVDYGQTASYADVARSLPHPSSPRAVGGAVGRNPIVIIIPCHRIIGAQGDLTGFGGGLERKKTLLALEGSLPG